MKNYWWKIEKFLAGELDPAFYARARIILRNLAVVPGDRVLEVGCGGGFYEKALSEIFGGVKIVGMDQNQKYLGVARREIGKGAEFVQGDAQKLPFKKACFQWIICSEVLEHIEDDNRAIGEMNRVLVPGGRALISVPHKNYPWQLDPLNWVLERLFGRHIPAHIWWLAGIWADHRRLYGEEELLQKFEKRGFKIIKVWRTGRKSIPGWHFLLYGIGKNLVERGLLKSFDRFNYQSSDQGIRRVVAGWVRRQTEAERLAMKGETFVNVAFLAQKV